MTRRFGSQMTKSSRNRSLGLLSLLLLAQVLLTSPSRAMDLVRYDLDSLVYTSTDIVVCTISVDAQKNIAATVTETLHGPLHPGKRIEGLSTSLRVFLPIEDGMNVILFLDHRPHTYNSVHSDAAGSPYAVSLSGVYLIDSSRHIHQYFPLSNLGPYVAQGYFSGNKAPAVENLELPTLAGTKRSIAASVKSVRALRPLLDKAATRKDIPRLFALLKSRVESGTGCGSQEKDAIVEQIKRQIRSFNDPDLLLRVRTLTADVISDIAFVQMNGRDVAFTSSRVAYLLRVLADKTIDSSLRVAAAETIVALKGFHDGPHNGPMNVWSIDNEWLVDSAERIRNEARTIFDDDSEPAELRSLCLQFLPLDEAESLADVKRVYANSHSSQLRFAVEEAFLRVSDSLYAELSPPGGPVTSVIVPARPEDCARARPGNIAFVMRYSQRKDFHDISAFTSGQYALTSIKTGQRIAPVGVRQNRAWSGMYDGGGSFELTEASDLPPGSYNLTREILREGQVLSAGYPLVISVEASDGKVIVANSSN